LVGDDILSGEAIERAAGDNPDVFPSVVHAEESLLGGNPPFSPAVNDVDFGATIFLYQRAIARIPGRVAEVRKRIVTPEEFAEAELLLCGARLFLAFELLANIDALVAGNEEQDKERE
jgi:hypothetical protein